VETSAVPGEEQLASDFLIRRTAGNGLDLAGVFAFHASPVWVLAALADLSGAGRGLVQEIAACLEQERLLDPGGTFETMDQVLDGLERTTGRLADAVSLPPLDVAGLRAEWHALCHHLAAIPPRQLPPVEFLAQVWAGIGQRARAEHRSLFEVSSLMALAALAELPGGALRLSRAALAAVRQTGGYFAEPLLDHYARTLETMADVGFFAFWRRQFRPYLKAAAAQFAPSSPQLTTRLLPGRRAPLNRPADSE
jgi:hypothetical protein